MMPNGDQKATPNSTIIEENCLIPQPQIKNAKTASWRCKYPPPYFMLTVSIFELLIFGIATKENIQSLRFDPNKQKEIWRFVTYMLLHNNIFHILLNVVMQCLFAVILEKNQGSVRVGILYFGSGVVGAITASCLRPDLVVGASAGVYALLISHLSHIALNYNSTKYKIWNFVVVVIIVVSDITYYFVHSRYKVNLIISEGAHVGGAVSGFLLGFILYKSDDKESKTRNKVMCWFALILFTISIITLLIVNLQIQTCTPEHMIKVKYVYIC